ncbi:hypothetical protein ADUPG1_012316 [Aduncisulcus paluster]|uniref:Uncharacterized protein n=1 Tax=Aduncisulcus paluster TaxID=2918883 RepID=A0ABQ5JZ29_9EUKA|nr:hypothetical protein ADUPG1_012316 [Aduncisulcus paluster]
MPPRRTIRHAEQQIQPEIEESSSSEEVQINGEQEGTGEGQTPVATPETPEAPAQEVLLAQVIRMQRELDTLKRKDQRRDRGLSTFGQIELKRLDHLRDLLLSAFDAATSQDAFIESVEAAFDAQEKAIVSADWLRNKDAFRVAHKVIEECPSTSLDKVAATVQKRLVSRKEQVKPSSKSTVPWKKGYRKEKQDKSKEKCPKCGKYHSSSSCPF